MSLDAHEMPTTTRPPLSRGRQLRILLIIAAVALVIIFVSQVLGWFAHREAPATAPLPAGTVQLTPAQRAGLHFVAAQPTDGADVTTATGMITADETQSTPVFLPYSGQITQVMVDTGSAVQRGQPLLRVKTGDIVDARNTFFAGLAQRTSAQALLRVAQANVHRQEELFKTAGGALKDYQQAQSDLVTAQSAVRTANASVGAARDKLVIFGKTPEEIGQLESVREASDVHAETTLYAPISGIISARAASVGQYVAAGGDKPVLTIANPSRVWLIAQLPESDAARVHVGDPVEVTTAAYPGRIFGATIDNIAAGLDPATHRLPVRASIANPDRALKPAMFADFTIRRPGSQSVALAVPADAVIHEGDTARVWVDAGGSKVESRVVRTGDSRDGMVKILAGLTPGTRVVTRGALFVNEAGLGE